MSRGSVWRKWDLHIHTPASFHHEYKFEGEAEKERPQGDIWEKYVRELERVHGIAVIGIADYFGIEGYQKALQYRESGRLQNFNLVLPNIEFRLDTFVGDRAINYHVIFSDEIQIENIEKEFLQELHVKAPNAEARPLCKGNIELIGRTLKEQHASFKGKPDYVVGCENITVSLEEIRDTLEKKRSLFRGMYLSVLAEAEWSLLDWDGRSHLTRKNILFPSHAIFSANPNTREWALGKRGSTPDEFVEEFGSLKPCLHGSDAHSFERLCRPDKDRFCWIKADCTFEGLRQILYEPEERVRIQAECPEYRKSIYSLSSVAIGDSWVSKDLSIEECKIPLNKNLIVVTGGKGDGKTAFLELIANCFEDRCRTEEVDRNSFVQRIQGEKPDLAVNIAFVGADVGEFGKSLTEEEFFGDSRITYLPQGKIEEYSGNRRKLHQKIEQIIFDSRAVREGEYRVKFEGLKNTISELRKAIDEISMHVYALEQESADEVMANIVGAKGVKQGELKNRQEELKKLTDSMEKGIKERIEKLKEEETELRVTHSRLETLAGQLKEFANHLIETAEDLNVSGDELNSELSELGITLALPELDFTPQLNAAEKATALVHDKVTAILEQIKTRRTQLDQLSGVEKAHAEILREIEGIQAAIEALDRDLETINRKRKEIEALHRQRQERYRLLLNGYREWKKYYDEVIAVFSSGQSEIMAGINFESTIHFDESGFVSGGLDLFDMRRMNEDQIRELADGLKTVITYGDQQVDSHELAEFLRDAFSKRQFLKSTRDNHDFYRWLFGDYFSLSTRIFFRNTVMEKLSIGQKGTVLLKLFLAEGDYPLIVDQPDKNLDNRFIYSELVRAIRDAKKRRQILIATNNGNLVVNTDAEQIIVAKFENNKITYTSGTLEDLPTRESIMPILEGGKEAFRKREQKYGM